jgi:hypothetical protein
MAVSSATNHHDFLTEDQWGAFVLISGRVGIDATDLSRLSFAPFPSTLLVDGCTKTSPGNRKKHEQNVFASFHMSHHRTGPEKNSSWSGKWQFVMVTDM